SIIMLINIANFSVTFQPWKPSHGRVFTTTFALDTETTLITGPELPDFILGAASDGQQGYFLTPDVVAAFLAAHHGIKIIFHHSPLDLAVLDKLFKSRGDFLDVYDLVDKQLVWDTMILHKLHGLAMIGHTHQGKDRSTLEQCAALYLGLELPKT